jgi:uncharacterized membrane protein (DUF106 family)
MMGSRPKQKQSGGGSRTVTYVLVAIIVAFVAFYFLGPVLFPPSTAVKHTGAVLSLTPGSDVTGAPITLAGQNFSGSTPVTAKWDGESLNLTGTCGTSASGVLSGCVFDVPKSSHGTYNVTVTAGSTVGSAKFTVPQFTPPTSTLIVTLTSVCLGLITQLVTRRVVDLDKERRMRAEVNAFNKEKREATLHDDKAKLEKLKRKELQMRQEQAKVSTARFKVTGITFIPLLAVYYLMSNFLGGFNLLVAYSPIPIPLVVAPFGTTSYGFISLFWWYFLSSFTFSSMLSKLLHTTP